MSDADPMVSDDQRQPLAGSGRRRAPRKRSGGCLPVLVVLVVVAVLGYFGVTKGIDAVRDQFSGPEDYPGPGSGQVTVTVATGDSLAVIGRNLADLDVVASVDAFTEAAADNPEAQGIQQGTYVLKSKMSASDAVELLVTGSAKAVTYTILPGKTIKEIVPLLADVSDIPQRRFTKVLDRPDSIGLPEEAEGNAEGYLMPGSYVLAPGATPTSILSEMVDRYESLAKELDLDAKAEALGYTPHELMTVASMVQAEAPEKYMTKVARVIYNRLEIDPNPAAGFLQIDATVNYALGEKPIAKLSTAQIDSVADSPYNTYRQKGLPPGPIETPSEAAITAALEPADGKWFFYVTVNLRTQLTKFAVSFASFQRLKAEFDDYCATKSDRC